MIIRLYRVNRIGPPETAYALLPPSMSAAFSDTGAPPPPPEPGVSRECVGTFTGEFAEKLASTVAIKLMVELGQRNLELYEVKNSGTNEESESLVATLAIYY